MNILLLTQIVPYPPDSGPKVKTFNVLRYLASRGYRVTLATFVRPHEEPYVKHLQPYCAEIHSVSIHRSRSADVIALASSFRSGLPFLVTRDAEPEMQRLMHQLARTDFDVVHADQLTMAQFAQQVRDRMVDNGRGSPSLVFDAHNAVWEIVERARQTASPVLRPLLTLESRRLKRYEGRLIQEFDHTLAVSELDRRALLKARAVWNHKLPSRQPAITVIPIAVDCQQLRPVNRAKDSQNLLTLGTLFYPPNADGVRWFIHQVLPHVRRDAPAATLTVVGPRPPQDIAEFGIRNSEFVKVTGYVPDLTPYLECAAVMVVPVRAASGMRVRILEALARGMPIVTTSTGVEGIDAVNGEHLLVADDPRDFARSLVKLLSDRNLREGIARNGRRLAEEKYDWRVALPRLETIYASLSRN